MIQAFSTQNLAIRYYDIPAIMNPLPNDMLAISYEAPSTLDPTWISIDEAESEFGRNLVIRSGKPSSRNARSKMMLNPQEKRQVALRELYINALNGAKTTPGCGGVQLRKEVIRMVQQDHGVAPISASTLGEWYRKSEEHEDKILATLPSKHRKRECTFSDEVFQLANDIIIRDYLKLSEPSITSAHKKLIKAIQATQGMDAEYPSYGTFRNWIKALDPSLIVSKRSGKQAEREMKRKIIKKMKTERILQRVEVDAVSLNIGINDDVGNYLGTVTLFVCIDCFSRAVLGYCAQIGRGETSASVLDSFKHAIITKKSEHLDKCKSDWPMHGLMELIVADGGSGYSAINTHAWCMRYGIARQTVETHSGWKKPFVESFFVSLRAKFAAELPGYVGKKKWNKKLDYTMKEQAVMTLDDFKLQLTRFIVDEYHQVKHSGLVDQSPNEAWTESAHIFPPVLPDDLSELQFCEGESKVRTIQGHKGIRVNNIYYNDDEGRVLRLHNLLKYTQSGKPEVRCEYSPNDISRITVHDPINDEVFEVETHDERIVFGMSLAEFAAKYPTKSQKKKDIETTQFSDKNPELEKLKAEHAAKCKQHSSRSQRGANLDEINEQTLKEKLRAETNKRVEATAESAPSITEDEGEDEGFDLSELAGAHNHA